MTDRSFNHVALADDLLVAGHGIVTVAATESTIHVAQVKTGVRVLSVPEYMEICTILGKEPMHYLRKTND